LGIFVEQGKPATLATVETHALTRFLWVTSASNITPLCLVLCLCTLLKMFDASLNVKGRMSQFCDILKNNLQT